MTYTDIKTQGWISYLPGALKPYALLMRLDRPVGWWLLLLPGWWGLALGYNENPIPSAHLITLGALFFIGAIFMRGAGCIINDLWDRNLDQKVERTKLRPLANGQISIRQAVIFLIVLLLLSFLILIQMSPVTILIGIGSLFFIILYPFMKRITFWPQAFLGITFNVGALMGYSAVTGNIALEALILYFAGIFWTLGYDTIYALQDKDDDMLVGIKSTALLFGQNVKKWIALFYTMTILLLSSLIIMIFDTSWAVLILIAPAAHFIWQVQSLRINDQSNALQRFQSNRLAGLLILLVFVLGLG